MRIFAGVPRGGGVKYSKCYTSVQTLNKNKKNISTDDEVMSTIKVASSFLGHDADTNNFTSES